MGNFDDIIKYENESTNLDFKAIQYKKEHYEALIKDIMSMANADTENDRYIIVGVKHAPSGDKEILGIQKKSLIDSATYQQVIRENIVPQVDLDYFPYDFEGKLLGIIKISKCFDKPYMMKKDFKKLKKGDCFIRKGTQQLRMERRDFDRIVEKITKERGFKGIVQAGFSNYNYNKEIELTTIGDVKLPSQRVADKIKKIIKEKRESERATDTTKKITKEKKELDKIDTQSSLLKGYSSLLQAQKLLAEKLKSVVFPFTPIPYEQRSVKELEKDLKEVGQIYHEHDYYEFCELKSHKINISILNKGHTYIEDASIQLEIKKLHGLYIADRIYEEPAEHNILIKRPLVPSYESVNYPEVNYTESSIIVCQTIGNVKHHIPIDAFRVPIRIVLLDQLAGEIIEIRCRIFGKNLTDPLEEILKIKAVSPTKTQP